MNDPAYQAAYREAHREEAREYARAYRAANQDKIRANNAAQYARNKEARQEYQRAYYAANREMCKESVGAARRRRGTTPTENHRCNSNRRAAMKSSDPAAVTEYVEILRGDPCCYCGAPTAHIDHIEPLSTCGTNEWDNLTAACASCNTSKGAKPLLTFMLETV